jgi:hypothetical protein
LLASPEGQKVLSSTMAKVPPAELAKVGTIADTLLPLLLGAPHGTEVVLRAAPVALPQAAAPAPQVAPAFVAGPQAALVPPASAVMAPQPTDPPVVAANPPVQPLVQALPPVQVGPAQVQALPPVQIGPAQVQAAPAAVQSIFDNMIPKSTAEIAAWLCHVSSAPAKAAKVIAMTPPGVKASLASLGFPPLGTAQEQMAFFNSLTEKGANDLYLKLCQIDSSTASGITQLLQIIAEAFKTA